MASLREYLEKMTDEELRGMLRGYCNGWVDIPIDTVLMICTILAERSPNMPDARASFRRFCEKYLDEYWDSPI